MNEGTIAYIGKGFGFIKVAGRQKDLFFHAKDLINGTQFVDLKVGDVLAYDDIVSVEKGNAAVGVQLKS